MLERNTYAVHFAGVGFAAAYLGLTLSVRMKDCNYNSVNVLSSQTTWQQEWFTNVKPNVLAGIVVALGLIPKAIYFSVIAGVDLNVGLYATGQQQ